MTVESLADAKLLATVEDEWYELTKGELALGGEDADFVDPATVTLVQAMIRNARDYYAMSATQQLDGYGNEIAEVTDVELARRIAAALALLWYGGGAA